MRVRDESFKIVIVKIFLNPLNILLCSMRFFFILTHFHYVHR